MVLLGIPAAVLAGSYVLVAVRHRTWNPFPLPLHESGRYTLLETVLYFRHFLREVAIGAFVGWAVALAALLRSPVPPPEAGEMRILRRRLGLGLLAGLSAVTVIVVWQEGPREALREVFQFRTRDEAFGYGTHWHYHLLPLLDGFVFSAGISLIWRGLAGAGPWRADGWRRLGAWLAGFLLVTLVFGSPARAFTDPLYLAHQAREIETQRLLTIGFALGAIWVLERRMGVVPAAVAPRRADVLIGLGMVGLATAIPAWIVWTLRHRDVPGLAQTRRGLWELAAVHHFEHVLDYAFVAAVAAWLYLGLIGGATRRRPRGSGP